MFCTRRSLVLALVGSTCRPRRTRGVGAERLAADICFYFRVLIMFMGGYIIFCADQTKYTIYHTDYESQALRTAHPGTVPHNRNSLT